MTVYANVDYDEAIWLEIPPWWGPETWPDYRDWAREMAQLWWDDSGLRPGEHQVDNLALTLAVCAERFGFPDPDETTELTTYLHLPDPRVMPLAVEVWVVGERTPGAALPAVRARAARSAVCDAALCVGDRGPRRGDRHGSLGTGRPAAPRVRW